MTLNFDKLTPNLMVKDVAETVLFYTQKLGFNLKMLVPADTQKMIDVFENGKKYKCAMLCRGEEFFMFMDNTSYKSEMKKLISSNVSMSGILYCDISDGIEKFRNDLFAKGVNIVRDIEITWYGMKEFYIEDCNGYMIGFGEKVK